MEVRARRYASGTVLAASSSEVLKEVVVRACSKNRAFAKQLLTYLRDYDLALAAVAQKEARRVDTPRHGCRNAESGSQRRSRAQRQCGSHSALESYSERCTGATWLQRWRCGVRD